MLILKKKWITALVLPVLTFSALSLGIANAEEDKDFGLFVEQKLKNQIKKHFGFKEPLEESAPETIGPYRTMTQSASDQVLLAKGLEVEYLTRNAGDLTDMMAFFPESNPTHLITSEPPS